MFKYTRLPMNPKFMLLRCNSFSTLYSKLSQSFSSRVKTEVTEMCTGNTQEFISYDDLNRLGRGKEKGRIFFLGSGAQHSS